MNTLSLNDILKKYKIKKPELVLHYIVISGEIPNELFRLLGISRNSQNYIINQSKILKGKNYLLSKKGNNLYGYQLSIKGTRYMANNDNYLPYLTSNQDFIHTTNDLFKRIRYRRTALLYYYLDKFNIDYFNVKDTNKENCFISSKFLKNIFHMEKRQPDTEYEIIGSKFFGLLSLENEKYLTYMFGDSLNTLYYGMEERTKFIIENKFNIKKTGTLIFFNSFIGLKKVFINVFYSIINENNNQKFNDIKYSFFKNIDFNDYFSVSFCSMDEKGDTQFNYIKQKKFNHKKIVEALNLYTNYLEEGEQAQKYKSDFMLNGYPVIILCDLDLSKVLNIYNRVHYSEDEYICYRIICYDFQRELLKIVFRPIKDNIIFYDIKKILDFGKQN